MMVSDIFRQTTKQELQELDHGITDQTSIIRFIEDNWNPGNIGNQSFDVKAGSILNMFDFTTTNRHAAAKLFLDNSTGLEK
jgi:phospholipase C